MQCKRKVSGEITAFLSLIFVLLISFIFALLESATIQTTKKAIGCGSSNLFNIWRISKGIMEGI